MVSGFLAGTATMVSAMAGLAEAKTVIKNTGELKNAFSDAKAEFAKGIRDNANANLDAGFAPQLEHLGDSFNQFGKSLEQTGQSMLSTAANLLNQGAAQAAISSAALRPIMPGAGASLGNTIDSLLGAVSSQASIAGQKSAIGGLTSADDQSAISDIAGGLIGVGGPALKAVADIAGMVDSAFGGGFEDESQKFAAGISVAAGARAGWVAGGPVGALAGAGLGLLTQLQQGQGQQDTTQGLLTAAGGYGLGKAFGLKGGASMLVGLGADFLTSEVSLPPEWEDTAQKAVQGGGLGAVLGNALFGGKGAIALGLAGALLNAQDSAGAAMGLTSKSGWGKIGSSAESGLLDWVKDAGLGVQGAHEAFGQDFASFRQGVADVTQGPLQDIAGAAHDPIDQAVFGQHGFLMHPGMFGPTSPVAMPDVPGVQPGSGMMSVPDIDQQMFPPGSKQDTVTTPLGTFQRAQGDDGALSFQNQFISGASSAYQSAPGQGSVLDTQSAPDASGAYQQQIVTQDPASGITRTQEQDFDPAKGGLQRPLVPVYTSPTPPQPKPGEDDAIGQPKKKGPGGPKDKGDLRGEKHTGGFHIGLWHSLSGGQKLVQKPQKPQKDKNKPQPAPPTGGGGGGGSSLNSPSAISDFLSQLNSDASSAPAPLSQVGHASAAAKSHLANVSANSNKVNTAFRQTGVDAASATAQTRQLDHSTQLQRQLEQTHQSNAGVNRSYSQVGAAGSQTADSMQNVQNTSGQAQQTLQANRQSLTPQPPAPPKHIPPPVHAPQQPPQQQQPGVGDANMSPLKDSAAQQQQQQPASAGGDIAPPPDPSSAGADLAIYQEHTVEMLWDAGFVLAGVESPTEMTEKHIGHMGQNVGHDTGNDAKGGSAGSQVMEEATKAGGGKGGSCATGKAEAKKAGSCASGAAGAKSPATKWMPIGADLTAGMDVGMRRDRLESSGHNAASAWASRMADGLEHGGYTRAADSVVGQLGGQLGLGDAVNNALANVANTIAQFNYNSELAGAFGAGLVAAANGVTPIAQDHGLMIGYVFAENIVTGAQNVLQSAAFADLVVPAFKSALAQADLGKLGLLPPAGRGAQYYTTTSGSAGMVSMTPVVNTTVTVSDSGGTPLQSTNKVLRASWTNRNAA
jgi:hypothetical protein